MTTAAHFYALAILVGMVQGGTQALSRSLFASMIPRHKSSEFFAFFGVFERYAGILGPLVFAAMVDATGQSRNAMLAVLGFFVVGGGVLLFVDVDAGRRGGPPGGGGAAPDMAHARRTPRSAGWRGSPAGSSIAPIASARCREHGAVLLLPNHPNALLDPARGLGDGRTRRQVSGQVHAVQRARSALSSRAPARSRCIARIDQGVDTSKNAEMFAAVSAALAAGDAVCIFPEGISHSTGRLEPLRTGAARMALGGRARRHAGGARSSRPQLRSQDRVSVARHRRLRPAVLGTRSLGRTTSWRPRPRMPRPFAR